MSGLVVIRGGGDIATGIAARLFNSGFKIVVLEIEKPSVIRRTVSFAQAVYQNEVDVEGIKAVLVNDYNEMEKLINENIIPVMIDDKCKIVDNYDVEILVDAILAKKNLGTKIDMANIVIGVGPGFEAKKDVDAVIETMRGHYLGRVILEGKAQKNTGIPGVIDGYGIDRVVFSPAEGNIKNHYNIGDSILKEQVISSVNGMDVKATIDGVIRGLINNKFYVVEGMKIGDIDPRNKKEYCFTISDKARAVGGGVLEAIMNLKSQKWLLSNLSNIINIRL